MLETRILKALQGKNTGRPPVWLMRQAGRYLPEYRALREKHSLRELFLTPELAAQVTHMPFKRYPLDAAILFSDITIVALALGLQLDFREGPVVTPKVTPQTPLSFAPEKLTPIFSAIRLLKPTLKVPLIGFCGAPFTVASYLAADALQWLRTDPQTFHTLLQQIEAITTVYIQHQVANGADAIQIFDSWANVLTKEEFLAFSLPYVERLTRAVSVPVIFFMRGAGVDQLTSLPAALSLDWEISLAQARQKTSQPLQGNLNPDLLFEPLPVIRRETQKLLDSMRGDPAFILNLGHGVKPGTPVEAVQTLVETLWN